MQVSLTGSHCRSASSLLHSSAGQGVRLGFAPLLARAFPTQDEGKEATAKLV